MGLMPKKFEKYPFLVWGMVLLTLVVLALLFGPENVWGLITDWAQSEIKGE
jgi:hypothetical protein